MKAKQNDWAMSLWIVVVVANRWRFAEQTIHFVFVLIDVFLCFLIAQQVVDLHFRTNYFSFFVYLFDLFVRVVGVTSHPIARFLGFHPSPKVSGLHSNDAGSHRFGD